jgi:hypothetical protein
MKQITIATLLCMGIVGCAGREDWTPKNLSGAKPAPTATSTTTTTSAPVEAKEQPATSEPAPEPARPPAKARKSTVHR